MRTKQINNLKNNESIVLFHDDYKVLMRTIASYIQRGQINFPIQYFKASVVVKDELKIGVLVTRTANQ